LISGGARGQGAAEAQTFAREGAKVVFGDVRDDEGKKVESEIRAAGGDAIYVHLDVTSEMDWQSAIKLAGDRYGRLDILINNAAWNDPVPLSDLSSLTPEVWDRALDTNLRGPFLVTRAAAPHLKRRDQGRVVNISGTPGVVPAGSIALAVSKAGLIHLTRCLAIALAPSVTVNCIAPGLMEGTRMSARVPPERVAAVKQHAALKRTPQPEDVARQVIAFCQSDSVTGQTQVIDSGATLPA
jgi:3-oxoacyl-[acyl-carrier protein] reductase